MFWKKSKTVAVIENKFVDVRSYFGMKSHIVTAETYVKSFETPSDKSQLSLCGSPDWLLREAISKLHSSFLLTPQASSVVNNANIYCYTCYKNFIEID